MKKSDGLVWKWYTKAAILFTAMFLLAFSGFVVKAEAAVLPEQSSSLKKEEDDDINPPDVFHFQMGVSKYPIQDTSIGTDSPYDYVIDGVPVFYSHSKIYFNMAAPSDGVVAYGIWIDAPDGSEFHSELETAPAGETFDAFSTSLEAELYTEGYWTYTALVKYSDGTWYGDVVKFAVFHKRDDQYIYVNSTFTKTYGTGGFSLNARTSGTGELSYSCSDRSVVKVSDSGWVTIVGYGVAEITVYADENDDYYEASETVTVKIIPDKVKITKISSPSKGKISCGWQKVSAVTGYEMKLSGAGNSFTVTTNKNTAKGSGKSKKTYTIKVRAYKIVDGVKYYGSWSAAKKVKVK